MTAWTQPGDPAIPTEFAQSRNSPGQRQSASSLDPLLLPKSVAVIGASEGDSATGAPKLGTAAMRHLVDHGFAGPIYPVNPRAVSILGRPAYPSICDVPGPVDMALIVVPAAAVREVLAACGRRGIKGAAVFSSGFSETGEAALEAECVRIARHHGMRLIGPNSAGVVNLSNNMVASISMVCAINPFRKGPVAFVTQSGALGGSLLGRAMEQGIGFSHWIASGNEADVDAAEYVDYLLDQPEVKVVALFLEGIRDADGFVAMAQKAARLGKPIIVYKAGASRAAAAAVASHTGALAGSDRVFDGICRQYGIVRVDDVAEMLPTAQCFAWLGPKLPRGTGVAVISASGGACGVAADELDREGLEVPELSQAAQVRLRDFTPDFAELRNPVDVTGQIRSFATGYQDVVRTVLRQAEIDSALLLITMAAEPRASFYGTEIPKLAAESDKPAVVAWIGALSVADKGHPMLSQAHVVNFLTVRQAVRALAATRRYRAYLERKGLWKCRP